MQRNVSYSLLLVRIAFPKSCFVLAVLVGWLVGQRNYNGCGNVLFLCEIAISLPLPLDDS